MAVRIIKSIMYRPGPRGAPGDMDPEEWDQWQADLAAKLPIADVLNEPDMATGATDKPPSQASVRRYVDTHASPVIGPIENAGILSGDVITASMRAAAIAGDGGTVDDHAPGIWPATTNDLLNSDFANGVTGWSIVAGTRAAVTSPLKFGSHSLQVTANGGSVNLLQSVSAAAPGPRSASVWVYAAPGSQVIGRRVQLQIHETGGSTGTSLVGQYIHPTLGSSGFPLVAGWNKLTASGTVVQSDRTGVRFQINLVGSPVAGDTFFISAPQLERLAVPTPYIPSTTTNGTRANARVVLPASKLSPRQGWALVAVRPSWDWDDAPDDPITLWQWGSGSTHITLDYTDGAVRLRRSTASGTETASRETRFAAGTQVLALARWTPQGVAVSINGSIFTNGEHVELSDDFERADMDPGLGDAPTGQTWDDLGTGDPAISDGRLVRSAGTTGEGTAGKVYAGITLTDTPVEMTARISFDGSFGPRAGVALICSNGERGRYDLGGGHYYDMTHPVINVSAWSINTYEMGASGVHSEPSPFLASGNYPNVPGATVLDETPGSISEGFYCLKTDGTMYDVTVRIDREQSTLALKIVHVDSGAVLVDRWVHGPAIRRVAGRYLIYQVYRFSTGDPPEDVDARIEEVTASVATYEDSGTVYIPASLPDAMDVGSAGGTDGHLAGDLLAAGAGRGHATDAQAATLATYEQPPFGFAIGTTLPGLARVWSVSDE